MDFTVVENRAQSLVECSDLKRDFEGRDTELRSWQCRNPQKLAVRIKPIGDAAHRLGLVQNVVQSERRAFYAGGGTLQIALKFSPCRDGIGVDARGEALPYGAPPFYDANCVMDPPADKFIVCLDDRPSVDVPLMACDAQQVAHALAGVYVKERFQIFLWDDTDHLCARQWTWEYEYKYGRVPGPYQDQPDFFRADVAVVAARPLEPRTDNPVAGDLVQYHWSPGWSAFAGAVGREFKVPTVYAPAEAPAAADGQGGALHAPLEAPREAPLAPALAVPARAAVALDLGAQAARRPPPKGLAERLARRGRK
ncbi:MAG: hypothetical protein J0L57_10975 [Burkholderiales bacterium]|nr:hypothetical protein [Burkholderiales bacterium]